MPEKINFLGAKYRREEQREMHAAKNGKPAVPEREASEGKEKQTYPDLHGDKKKTSWRPEETVQCLLQLIKPLKHLKPRLKASTKWVKKLFILPF